MYPFIYYLRYSAHSLYILRVWLEVSFESEEEHLYPFCSIVPCILCAHHDLFRFFSFDGIVNGRNMSGQVFSILLFYECLHFLCGPLTLSVFSQKQLSAHH